MPSRRSKSRCAQDRSRSAVTRFQETFDKVNAGLKEKFPRLFGGGHAYLEIEGEELEGSSIFRDGAFHPESSNVIVGGTNQRFFFFFLLGSVTCWHCGPRVGALDRQLAPHGLTIHRNPLPCCAGSL